MSKVVLPKPSKPDHVAFLVEVPEATLWRELQALQAEPFTAGAEPPEISLLTFSAAELRQLLQALPQARAAHAAEDKRAAEQQKSLAVEAFEFSKQHANAMFKNAMERHAVQAGPVNVTVEVPPGAIKVLAQMPAAAPTVTTTEVVHDKQTGRIKETRATTRPAP